MTLEAVDSVGLFTGIKLVDWLVDFHLVGFSKCALAIDLGRGNATAFERVAACLSNDSFVINISAREFKQFV